MICRCALALVLLIESGLCCKASQRCLALDVRVNEALQLYARKSNTSGDIMDIVSMFAPWVGTSQVDPRSIRPEDLHAWKSALEEQVQAGVRALQQLWNYEIAGCNLARQQELAQSVSQLNEGLALAQGQLLAITPIARSPGFSSEGMTTTARQRKACHTRGRKSACLE